LNFKIKLLSLAWLLLSIIPALRRLRQEDCEFKGSLGYRMRHYLKKKKSSFNHCIYFIQRHKERYKNVVHVPKERQELNTETILEKHNW
jgi:hypothetical protein